jgi:Na+/melibiose symporter-like transporter
MSEEVLIISIAVLIIIILFTQIYTLIKQAKNSEWSWFVMTLIFGFIVVAIYWLIVLVDSIAERRRAKKENKK